MLCLLSTTFFSIYIAYRHLGPLSLDWCKRLQEVMKKTTSRFIVLPFYMGCLSQSSTSEFKNSKFESKKVAKMEGESSSSSMAKIKKSLTYVAPTKSNISKAMDKLYRVTFKGFTHIFAYKDFEDIDIESELEIGLPTDVKHVTHIGYDGSMTTNPDQNWDHLQPHEKLSLPSDSLKQLELAMAAQAERRGVRDP